MGLDLASLEVRRASSDVRDGPLGLLLLVVGKGGVDVGYGVEDYALFDAEEVVG